jgi:[ribosomal protein S18]-alanine N-acetyltransferase
VALISPLVVEPMRMADVPTVHEIERLSFSTPWPAHAFEQELTGNRMARYLIARAGEQVVGFGGIWLMVDEAHITTFGVHPEWRRRGVGRQLLIALVELSEQMRASRMTLEVRAGNQAAQELYRRFGFIVAGRRARYYTDDGEDALIMTTPALAGPRMRAILARERELMAE